MADPRRRLETLYGDQLPPGLAGLSETDLQHLADAVDNARRRQRAALRAATEAGMKVVPRVLRGPVRRVLFG